MFKIVNKLTNITKSILPEHENEEDLATSMANYFSDKIVSIRNILENLTISYDVPERRLNSEISLQKFNDITDSETVKVIKSYPIKTCKLDPLPSPLLKESLTSLVPSITKIVNLSLQTSVIPGDLKQAVVIPLIKKPTLDPNVLSNYRPISNQKLWRG